MKKKLTKLLIVVIAANANLYSQPNKEKHVKFPVSYSITGQDLSIIHTQPVLLAEMSIVSNKDYLLSFNALNDTIFRVFKLPELEYAGSFGTQGRGPREFGIFHPSALPEGFLIPNSGKFTIVSFNQNERITDKNFIIKQNIRLPGEFHLPNDAMILNDTLLCVKSYESKMQLQCVNPRTNKIYHLIEYPKYYSNAPISTNTIIYSGSKSLSPDRKNIAIAYNRLPLVQFFSAEGKLLRETFIDEGPRQKRDVQFAEGSVTNLRDLYSFYGRTRSTNRFVYASYLVRTFNNNQRTTYTTSQIHIFNWKGDPILKLELPKGMLFEPSYDDKWIYFIDNAYSDRILKFDLSKFLK